MGLTIRDLEDDDSYLFVNFWNWRPTAELIRSFKIVEPERYELMQISGIVTEFSANEAKQIGQRIRTDILPSLGTDERLLLNLTATDEPDDGIFHRGDTWEQNYSATREWLEQFSNFCLTSNGFYVC